MCREPRSDEFVPAGGELFRCSSHRALEIISVSSSLSAVSATCVCISTDGNMSRQRNSNCRQRSSYGPKGREEGARLCPCLARKSLLKYTVKRFSGFYGLGGSASTVNGG